MADNTDIPTTYTDVPPGFTEGPATFEDLQSAGFHQGVDLGEDRPGQQPLGEMLVKGEQVIPPDVLEQIFRNTIFRVLRDRDGDIVANWDEGRWWTPEESDEGLRRILDDMDES